MTQSNNIEILGINQLALLNNGDAFLGMVSRIDSKYGNRADSLDRYRVDSLKAQEAKMQDAVRQDTGQGSAAAGYHMTRDLEHVYGEVLREQRPVLNAFRLIPLDGSVPPGARTHTVRRTYANGEAKTYRRGEDIPRVGVSKKEEVFNIRHYVTSAGWSMFEEQSSDFAGSGLVAELVRTMRDVVEEHANYRTWYGSDEDGLYGVFTYPYLRKKIVLTPFTSASTPRDILRELHRLVNFPYNSGRQTFAPDTLVTSPRIRSFLFETPMDLGTDTTIGEHFLRNNPRINSIEEAQECHDPGSNGAPGMPPGQDVILCYRRDRMGVVNVVPRPFTMLPGETQAFERKLFGYMSHGGVIMRDIGNNILGLVSPPDLF